MQIKIKVRPSPLPALLRRSGETETDARADPLSPLFRSH